MEVHSYFAVQLLTAKDMFTFLVKMVACPLRMFFSGGTKTEQGKDVSWDAVRARLKEIIDAEDKSKPLNDDQLVDGLKARGIEIARRTVAKYRGLMDIPSARKRRQY